MASSSGYSTSWVDFLPLALIFVSAALIFMSGRSKMLKCPNCGTVFPPPAFDNKRSGVGWTLPHMGSVKCPKCGESRGRRDYQKIKVKEPKYTGTIQQPGPSDAPYGTSV